jgi:hypothetical protein
MAENPAARPATGCECAQTALFLAGPERLLLRNWLRICEAGRIRHCNVIAPFVSASGNRNESPLLLEALPEVLRISREVGLDLQGTIASLDGIYDWRVNCRAIFNCGMVPNINPDPRGRKQPKRGRKPIFEPPIFKEHFWTIERVFAWEDKFRRLLLRFERISGLHYAFQTLVYTMINLRHYCQI